MESTGPNHDRRSFLFRLGAAALVAPVLPLAACEEGRRRTEEGAPASERSATAGVGAHAITRPVLLPWGPDDVRIDAPPREMPVAYVSMATRRLFVDRDYRDEVSWDLIAHISVSTGVWRIPLAEDSPREPVTPGDVLREFEELTMRDWDPTALPAEDDMRIMRGAPVRRHVEFDCAPLAGGAAWLRAGPWDIGQCGEPSQTLCREDFFPIGRGLRFADRDCTVPEGAVRFFTWACRPGINPSDG
jgi:hypothetical protein